MVDGAGSIGKVGIFVRQNQPDAPKCAYILPFGFGFICRCPVRMEYYRVNGK